MQTTKRVVIALLAVMLVTAAVGSLPSCGGSGAASGGGSSAKLSESSPAVDRDESRTSAGSSGTSDSGSSASGAAETLSFQAALGDAEDYVSILLEAPPEWQACGDSICEGDRQVAQVLSAYPASGASGLWNELDVLYAQAVSAEEVACGQHAARYYWMQTETTKDGVSGYENEFFYYVSVGDCIIAFRFLPARGVGGIAPQRETFEKCLAGIRLG